jgi:hypothetical protein
MPKKKSIDWTAAINAEDFDGIYSPAKVLSIGRKAVDWLVSMRLKNKLKPEEISVLQDVTSAYLTLYLVGCNNALLSSTNAQMKNSLAKYREATKGLLLKLMIPYTDMSIEAQIEKHLEVLETIQEQAEIFSGEPSPDPKQLLVDVYDYTPPSDEDVLAETEKLLTALEKARPIEKKLQKFFDAPPGERQAVLNQLFASTGR